MKPFLQYVGGKRKMLKHIKPLLKSFEVYHEPCVGGGALFFDLEHNKNNINDLNPRLIRVYKTIKNNVEAVCDRLKKLQDCQNKKDYYIIRKDFSDKNEDVEFTANYIYFNKSSFGSVMRFNRSGYFNVPYAQKNITIYKEEHLKQVSNLLIHTNIRNYSALEYCNNVMIFSDQCNINLEGHLFYFDPPYIGTVATDMAYSVNFTEKDAVDISVVARMLNARGASVIVSFNEIMHKYFTDFKCLEHENYYCINSKKMKKAKELIFLKGDFNV